MFCTLVVKYGDLEEYGASFFCYAEDRGSRLCQNIGAYIPDYDGTSQKHYLICIVRCSAHVSDSESILIMISLLKC
jgi:hypothetical protein